MISWIKEDWKHNRFRLFCETIGAICFISIYVLMAWYGDAVSVFAIFLIQIAGSSLHIVNAYMRNSANILMLNVIVIVIAVFGIGKMFLGE